MCVSPELKGLLSFLNLSLTECTPASNPEVRAVECEDASSPGMRDLLLDGMRRYLQSRNESPARLNVRLTECEDVSSSGLASSVFPRLTDGMQCRNAEAVNAESRRGAVGAAV